MTEDNQYKVYIQKIQEIVPRAPDQGNSAISGLIPIERFNEIEHVLRPLMRKAVARCIYRGPRKSNATNPITRRSHTRRCDATHVLIYLQ